MTDTQARKQPFDEAGIIKLIEGRLAGMPAEKMQVAIEGLIVYCACLLRGIDGQNYAAGFLTGAAKYTLKQQSNVYSLKLKSRIDGQPESNERH